MPQYRKQKLTFIESKQSVAAKGSVDGVYHSDEGSKYLVKRPVDTNNLFAELFAGFLLEELKKAGPIHTAYTNSLISWDYVLWDDQKYALIRPEVDKAESPKENHTAVANAIDITGLYEVVFGQKHQEITAPVAECFGLSVVLMYSLLFGAYYIHSANIVTINSTVLNKPKQFARIDWQDAFKDLAQEGNEEILIPYARTGFFNFTAWNKSYLQHFRNIKGLFPNIAENAKKLQSDLTRDKLVQAIQAALAKIPKDFFDETAKSRFADYLAIPSFNEVVLGVPCEKPSQFVEEFANKLLERLSRLTMVTDHATAIENPMYESLNVDSLPIPVQVDTDCDFSLLMQRWHRLKNIDVSEVDLKQLAQLFNTYICSLADTIPQSSQQEEGNVFAPYCTVTTEAKNGVAFVAQYTESRVFKNLSLYNLDTLTLDRFTSYEAGWRLYIQANPDSKWSVLEKIAVAGQGIFNTLCTIHNAFAQGEMEIVMEQYAAIPGLLQRFVEASAAFVLVREHEGSNANFYSISKDQLAAMSGDQLATICLQELQVTIKPTTLVVRILQNNDLWDSMDAAFASGRFDSRKDNPATKISTLREWRQLFALSEPAPDWQAEVIQLRKQIHTQQDLLSGFEIDDAEKSRVFETTLSELQGVAHEANTAMQRLQEEHSKQVDEITELAQRVAHSKELIAKLQSAQEIRYAAVIQSRLLPLIEAYRRHLLQQAQGYYPEIDYNNYKGPLPELVNKDDAALALLHEKYEQVSNNLLTTLEGETVAELPSQRVAAFQTALEHAKSVLNKHRDPDWLHFCRNCLLAIAVIATGVLPGIVGLYVHAQVNGKSSPFFFNKTKGEQLTDALDQELNSLVAQG